MIANLEALGRNSDNLIIGVIKWSCPSITNKGSVIKIAKSLFDLVF
jgi:hypothetical protein